MRAIVSPQQEAEIRNAIVRMKHQGLRRTDIIEAFTSIDTITRIIDELTLFDSQTGRKSSGPQASHIYS